MVDDPEDDDLHARPAAPSPPPCTYSGFIGASADVSVCGNPSVFSANCCYCGVRVSRCMNHGNRTNVEQILAYHEKVCSMARQRGLTGPEIVKESVGQDDDEE